ncbi:MAG: hypothetical protein HY455_03595 [Parcubacteria group bacterium]|nr:hypothetical protein [Parcubacteria group bacterium]
MEQRELVLVARDVAPSKALLKLGEAGWPLGIVQHRILGNGTSIDTGVVHTTLNGLRYKACLVSALSSHPHFAETEIRACEEALRRGIPYGFYADTWGIVAGRPHFTEKIKHGASFLFVVNEKEARRAREYFPNAKIVASGNPMQEDWFFPKRTYIDVRLQMGVLPEQIAILCPSGKDLAVNLIHFSGAIEAAGKLNAKAIVFLAIHPGDPPEHLKHYEFLAKYAGLVSGTSIRLVTKDAIPCSELLVGCDVVVASMSTIDCEAACQRKPVIDFMSQTALGVHSVLDGGWGWELATEGASFPIYGDTGKLRTAIELLLNKESSMRREQIRFQKRLFPTPTERGVAVRLMRETVLGFLK